jgi:hypothetical protein
MGRSPAWWALRAGAWTGLAVVWGASRSRVFACGRRARVGAPVFSGLVGAGVTAGPVEESDGVGHHLRGPAGMPFAVLVVADLEPSLDGEEPPFAPVAGDELRRLPPRDDVDEVGLPLAVPVDGGAAHREGEPGDGHALSHRAALRVADRAAHQDDGVEHARPAEASRRAWEEARRCDCRR